MLKAVTRQASRVDAKVKAINSEPPDGHQNQQQHHPISTAYFFDHFATPEDLAVMVTEQDFLNAHTELIPSVSAGELAHYERVRAAFEGAREGQSHNAEGTQGRRSPLDHRVASAASAASAATTVRGAANAKGKGKAVAGKGKGKAVALSREDEFSDSSNDGSVLAVNGRPKGKGKAAATFHDGAPSDDEGLYE